MKLGKSTDDRKVSELAEISDVFDAGREVG